MNSARHILPGALLLATLAAQAQDPQFSQFYAAAQYVNPALTGNTHQDRIALNYRLQWPGVQPGYESFMAAYDHRFSTMNGGIGGMAMRDKAGTNGLTSTTVGLVEVQDAAVPRLVSICVCTGISYFLLCWLLIYLVVVSRSTAINRWCTRLRYCALDSIVKVA